MQSSSRRVNMEKINSEQKSTKVASNLVPIGNMKFVKVYKYKQEPCVNIRDFMKDASTERVYSTKRCLMLSPSEWDALKRRCDDIDRALKSIKEE